MRTLALVAAITLPTLSARPAVDPTDDVMHRVMQEAHIAGAAVAIVRDGKIVRISSYGNANVELPSPVTANTPFQIASATKIYSSVLLMRMVEQHKIDLDAPVTKYLPDAPATWASITVRNLATHTSGLEGVRIDAGVVSTADAMKFAVKATVSAKPGERADYASFDDYTVVQYMLEKISGKPFPQLMHDELFAPAGMTCSAFDMAENRGPQRVAENIPGRAEYYRWIGTLNQRRWFLYTQWAYASGGVYSCAHDMATLLAALDAGKILSPASLRESQKPFTLLNGSAGEFGIGWTTGSYRGHRWAGHSGGPAFSDVMYFPDDHLGIVVFTNQQRLYPELASLLADQFITAPASYGTAGKQDDAPNLTAEARAVLQGAAKGAADSSLFAPSQRQDYVADINDLGPVWLGVLGPVTKMLLMSDELGADGARARRYRVFFGDHAQAIRFRFDKDGKVISLNPHGD